MTTQYFKVRNGLTVGEDAVTVDAATGNVIATGDLTVKDTVTIEGATSGSVALAAPAVAGSQSYTLPTALPGVSGYVLAADTSGVMSWVPNPDLNTTYTIDASATTGGANLNLVGSDATTDTVKFAEGVGIDIVQTDANTITTTLNATLDNLSNVDNTTTALAAGQMFYYNGTNWVNSTIVDSPNLNRFSRTNNGTGNNAIVAISRNRADAARAVDGGPWLGFEYVGTDNTQTTAPQNAIRSRYQTSGNHQMQFVQLPGDYNTPTIMGQIQRGNHFLNTTGGVAAFFLSDTVARIGGNTTNITNSANTATYAQFLSTSITLNGNSVVLKNSAGTTTNASFADTGAAIYGTDLTTVYRTRTGTPGVVENRPSMNIQLSRSDQAVPNDGDGTSFRARVAGSSGVAYTIADISSTYKTGGDVVFNVNLANGDQTGAAFSSLNTFSNSITRTSIKAGTPSGTPGASTASDVAVFTPTNNIFRADALTLTNYTGVALVGNKISYNRVYGQFEYTSTVTPAAANTAYVFPLGTSTFSNIASVGSTSRLIIGAPGIYNFQFSVQCQNADNANDHEFYIWLRKNGTDVPGSTGRMTLPKSTTGSLKIVGWNFVVDSANTTDYYELAYAVSDTQVTFPAFGALAFAPGTSSLVTTITPIGA